MSSFLQRWAAEPEKHETGACAVEHASALLNGIGARIIRLNDSHTIDLWRERDGQEVRSALITLRMDELPVRYLDEDGTPESYKSTGK